MNRENILSITLFLIILFLFMLVFVVPYYSWECKRLSTNPFYKFGYAPARCIK